MIQLSYDCSDIKKHPEKLKDFFGKLYQIETDILLMSKQLETLYVKRIDIARKEHLSVVLPLMELNEEWIHLDQEIQLFLNMKIKVSV